MTTEETKRLVGKTIARITQVGPRMCLFFTDDTHQCIGIDRGHEPGDATLCLEDDPVYSNIALHALGLITTEKYQRRMALADLAYDNVCREKRRREYLKLKAEFEPGKGESA